MLRASRLSFVRALSLVIGLLMALISCGGGAPGDTQAGANANGTGGVGTGGTGSYTNGPISGLGSIIVNNVRYDVATATVLSDDELTHDASELQLGMTVEVSGSGITPVANGATPVATAGTVRYTSDLIGQVSAIDGVSATLTVLGQTVRINSKTVQPLVLAVNDVVVVYGLSDASGYTATRIDKLDPATSHFKIAGAVVSVDRSRQLLFVGQGGGLPVSYQGLDQDATDALSAGDRVRVWFDRTQVNASWQATRIRVDSALVQDTEEASLEGLITQLPGVDRVMKLNGAPVDLSAISPWPTLALGQRVRVEGRLLAGVLLASELSDEAEADIDDQSVELHGQVSQLDVQAQTFVLRGVTVSYTPAVLGGRALANNLCVEVYGQAYNASRQLIATEVEMESDCD